MKSNKRQRQSIGVQSLSIIFQAVLQSLLSLAINVLPLPPRQPRQRLNKFRSIREILDYASRIILIADF